VRSCFRAAASKERIARHAAYSGRLRAAAYLEKRAGGNKYRQVLKHFKVATQHRFEQVCQILAMWLNDEGIRKPEELLPDDILEKILGAQKWQADNNRTVVSMGSRQLFGNFRPAGLRYAEAVAAVIPYFKILLRAYHCLRTAGTKEIDKKLRDLGFEADAVRAIAGGLVRRTRSVTSAACQFVADRAGLDEDTVKSTFSTVYGRKPRARRKSTAKHKKGSAT
jgi:hypothetical protein